MIFQAQSWQPATILEVLAQHCATFCFFSVFCFLVNDFIMMGL